MIREEDKKEAKDILLEMVKIAKNQIIRKQLYEEAVMLRNLEGLLIDEENVLSARSLSRINNILQTITKSYMETTTTKQLNFTDVKNQISEWLKNYATQAGQKGYIIGVSGGIDSAVCSTLCAMTGFPLTVVKMSIHQAADQADRGAKHIEWLQNNFKNVRALDIDLSEAYDKEIELLTKAGAFDGVSDDQKLLTCSNTRSRLRMVTLYGVGGAHKLLVCGTGNKVEDYGIGFFTKFGDGGIDVSPIGELMKSEVYALGKELGVIQEILDARPTDGLWADGRTDEDQIGATYDELEWAMDETDKVISIENCKSRNFSSYNYSDRQIKVLNIYLDRHNANAHKMIMPPICSVYNLRN